MADHLDKAVKSHLEMLFVDLRNKDTQCLDETLKLLGQLRIKADLFWSPMVELEGTVSSVAFKQYEGYKGKVYQAIRWVEDIWMAYMEGQDLLAMRSQGEFLFQKEQGSI
ncbi:hypothetical protein C8J56DRAFT_895346 [Mycena floridula]|nr:hypothetical protein C8J56DRAFT_895346 [Mycena floridula]